MIRIQKLKRPTKRSGFRLSAGRKTEMKGVIIINNSGADIFVDKFSKRKR